MSDPNEYARQIEQHIPNAQATVEGAGGKFSAVVVSDAFEGQGLLGRHRMVYAALDPQIKSGEIHALDPIRAYTPSEWEATS
jgi:acid stress-induced BolA-like protein IbaG/YrbA